MANLSKDSESLDETWSRDEETFNCNTLGELIDTYDDLQVGDTVYVGEQDPGDVTRLVDANDIIEMLAERAYDNFGECAEDWPPAPLPVEAVQELNTFLAAWITKHCPQRFYHVRNVKPYTITAEDLA